MFLIHTQKHKSTITRKELYAAYASFMNFITGGDEKKIGPANEIMLPFIVGMAAQLDGQLKKSEETDQQIMVELAMFLDQNKSMTFMQLQITKMRLRNSTAAEDSQAPTGDKAVALLDMLLYAEPAKQQQPGESDDEPGEPSAERQFPA